MPAGLGDGDKGRVRLLLLWFNAMTSEDERKTLLPTKPVCQKPTDGEKHIITKRLHDLVVARVSEGFLSAGVSVPQKLAKGLLPATGIEDRVRELKKLNVSVVASSQAFQQWREARDAMRAQAASATAEPASGEKRRRP